MFSVYANRKILITGHTGFKGSWLTVWLLKLGAEVCGYALDPKSARDNYPLIKIDKDIADYRADIRDFDRLCKIFHEESPEIIFHMAAQPLVLESYRHPRETIETNTQGTVNVMEAFRQIKSAKILIIITTDKVYKNNEWIWGYRENDILGGDDPYSAGKAAAELLVNAYQRSFFQHSDKIIVTVRAGNVIGGGDWAENRILPDCIRAIETDSPLSIRNPNSTRPWQHVLEPLSGYLLLGKWLLQDVIGLDGAWNFGPNVENSISVESLVQRVIACYGKGIYVCEHVIDAPKEAKSLSLDISKAAERLDWKPRLSIDETIKMTVEWYKNYKSTNVLDFNLNQINQYEEKWLSKNIY